MAESRTSCRLQRPNHSSEMVDVFGRMFVDDSTKDCALMCADGHPVRAHRMILSASSPFFKSVFDQMSNYCPNYPIIYLKDMPINDLRVIIEFIYRGEVTVCQSQLESVLRSGESLKVKGLEDIDTRDDGSYSGATVLKKKRRRKLRKNSSNSNDNNTNEKIGDFGSHTTDDSLTESSEDEKRRHTIADTPTDLSDSQTYNGNIKPPEDGIKSSRPLKQLITTEDTQVSNGFKEKVISINSKQLPKKTIQTIDLDGSPVSPVKLKMKTLGTPVRTKSDRKKLDGFSCKECEEYYRSKNLTEDQLNNKLNVCSRHRSKFSPPKSPEHFWDTDFPSTPECIARGYLNVESKPSSSTQRKKRK